MRPSQGGPGVARLPCVSSVISREINQLIDHVPNHSVIQTYVIIKVYLNNAGRLPIFRTPWKSVSAGSR
jgi:hypothetical protein